MSTVATSPSIAGATDTYIDFVYFRATSRDFALTGAGSLS